MQGLLSSREETANRGPCEGAHSPDGNSDYSYSSYSVNSIPQMSSIDHDEGPSATSSASWRIAADVSPDGLSHARTTSRQPLEHRSPQPYHRHRIQLDAVHQKYGLPANRVKVCERETPAQTRAQGYDHSPAGSIYKGTDQAAAERAGEGDLTPDSRLNSMSRQDTSEQDIGCDSILANLFQQHPDLQIRLMHLLEDSRAEDNDYLDQQVRELLKDHKQVIAALNAVLIRTGHRPDALRTVFSKASMKPRSSRSLDALFTTITETGARELRSRVQKLQTAVQSRLVPPQEQSYLPVVVPVIVLLVACISFFMAGGYSQTENVTPSQLRHWLSFKEQADLSFGFEYVLEWGGQYLPAIANHQGWRWITAAFLHTSFQHMLANMLLLVVFGGMLEYRYGPVRVLIVACIATMGAALFAGALASPCLLVVGSSGTVMGFVGLTVVDILLNSKNRLYLCLRLIITLAAICFFVVTALTKSGEFTSNWSHLGGFLCGLFPSFLFIPDLSDERWRPVQEAGERLHRKLETLRHSSLLSGQDAGIELQSTTRAPQMSPTSSPHPQSQLARERGVWSLQRMTKRVAAREDQTASASIKQPTCMDRETERRANQDICKYGDPQFEIDPEHRGTTAPDDFSVRQNLAFDSRLEGTSLKPRLPFAASLSELPIMDTALDLEDVRSRSPNHWTSVPIEVTPRNDRSRPRQPSCEDDAYDTDQRTCGQGGLAQVRGKMFAVLRRHCCGVHIHILFGTVSLVVIFTVLPSYIYLYRLKHLTCPAP